MDDEVLAGLPQLVGVVHAGVDERLLDQLAVDLDGRLLGVLLDDREQVPEQLPLLLGQLGSLDRCVAARPPLTVDRRARLRDQRRGAVALLAPALGAAQAAIRRGVALLRYRRPSSYRRM
jgi:hypothetical protein